MPVGAFAEDKTTEGVTTITPEDVANTEDGYYPIRESGVYNLEGGTYTGGYIAITRLADNVTINLLGDITVPTATLDDKDCPTLLFKYGMVVSR